MLISTLVLAAMIQSPTAAVDTGRAAFTKCLRTHMTKSLDAKMSPAEYDMAVKTICSDEREAFRKAVVTLNRSGGDSAADATDNAEMQIEDYHANFSEKFKDYSESNTRPEN